MIIRKYIKKFYPIRESRPIVEIDGTETNIVEMSQMMRLRRMIFRFLGSGKDQILTYFRAVSEVKTYLRGNTKKQKGVKNFLWFPQYYGIGGETSKKCLKSVHNIVVDVDSKICPSKKEFLNLSEKLLGKGCEEHWDRIKLPKPTFVVCSGSGLHLYWTLKTPVYIYKNKDLLTVVEKVHREVIHRIEQYYNAELDKISIVQGFRVPGSLSKSGKTVLAYKVRNGFYDTFENLLKDMEFSVEENSKTDDPCEKNVSEEKKFSEESEERSDSVCCASAAVEEPGVTGETPHFLAPEGSVCHDLKSPPPSEQPKKKTSTERVKKHRMKYGYKNWKYVPIRKDEVRALDQKAYLSGIYKALDANVKERARFVGKVISMVVGSGKIPEGARNMRLFAVCVALTKGKANDIFIMDIVKSINAFICEKPLPIEELKRMIKSAKKYIKMTWEKMKSYIYFGVKKVVCDDFENCSEFSFASDF